jgi:hypothetical protein
MFRCLRAASEYMKPDAECFRVVPCSILDTDFGERYFFYELRWIVFSLSCFGMIDTIGIRAMGPALRS